MKEVDMIAKALKEIERLRRGDWVRESAGCSV
jgi:hypothetical protein